MTSGRNPDAEPCSVTCTSRKKRPDTSSRWATLTTYRRVRGTMSPGSGLCYLRLRATTRSAGRQLEVTHPGFQQPDGKRLDECPMILNLPLPSEGRCRVPWNFAWITSTYLPSTESNAIPLV